MLTEPRPDAHAQLTGTHDRLSTGPAMTDPCNRSSSPPAPAGGLARRVRDYFAAADANPGDEAELWGRRIGRAANAVALLALAIWLVASNV